MALTLTEAAKLSNDVVKEGVILTTVKDSPILERLPFIEIVGNGLTYNRENAVPAVSWFAVGDTWTEATPTFTQVTTALTILGGDADVDNYIRMSRSNVQDIEAEVLALKLKALRYEFETQFIIGDGTSNKISGLRSLVTGGQVITAGTNGATLTLDMVDQLIDLIRPGKPDLLLMSRRTRRKLTALVRAAGSQLQMMQNEFGRFQEFYNAVPIGVSDFQPDDETQGTSGAVCSSIYALKLGDLGLMGLQSPESIQAERIGSLETKDAMRWRAKWYVSLALLGTLGAGRLQGINNT